MKNFFHRNQFEEVKVDYLHKHFEEFLKKNPQLNNYKPRYWNIYKKDIFESLDAFEDRLNQIKVCIIIF